ncbi:MAG: DnaD domain protein [Clostridia bacterium]|nr:DnaD domain protein [Clostridia bacterium]
MCLCKYSSSYIINDKTVVDNIFINNFLPDAPDLCVKVYLMGLSKCANSVAPDNNITNFANVLNVSEQDIVNAFNYWQEQGVVQILSTNPMEVRFMPLNASLGTIKKFNVGKYTDFNIQVQEILSKRMITPTEFSEYYNVIEKNHIQPEALIMIIKYCANLKGENVSYPYIITVAKNWEKEGVHTSEDVENKITELGVLDDKVTLVLGALGTKRKVQLEDVQMLNRWLGELDFDLNTIVAVAKRCNLKKVKADINYLNNLLTKYYEMRLNSIMEIENYETQKDNMTSLARLVVKGLGLYYEDLSKVIDTYVVKWVQMGYTDDILVQIADYAFKNSIRTLEAYDRVVQKLYKLGIITIEAFNEYMGDINAWDDKVRALLEKLGIKRYVNEFDREFYRTWTENWGFNEQIINFATSLSVGKANAMQYMNKILSSWKAKGVTTIEQAEANSSFGYTEIQNKKSDKYTKEQLNSFFSNLDEVEI